MKDVLTHMKIRDVHVSRGPLNGLGYTSCSGVRASGQDTGQGWRPCPTFPDSFNTPSYKAWRIRRAFKLSARSNMDSPRHDTECYQHPKKSVHLVLILCGVFLWKCMASEKDCPSSEKTLRPTLAWCDREIRDIQARH